MTIRPEKPEDFPEIRRVVSEAFGQAAEADLVDALRRNGNVFLSLVAEREGAVIGHILFSAVNFETTEPQAAGQGLAPLAVSPEAQNQGVGSALVKEGLDCCRRAGVAYVVVLGHPSYYPRFGFQPASRFGIRSEYDSADEAFMLIELQSRALQGCAGIVKYQAEFDAV
jgi:putative acetyltransferase